MSDILERARKYLAKVPPAISGAGGHNQTFYAACRVVKGFDLSEQEGLTLLREWNASCSPQWNEKELSHKVKEAMKADGEKGFLLKEARDQNNGNGKAPSLPAQVIESPASELRELLDSAMSGRRYPVAFPWPSITSLTNALLPGTITVLSAGYGSAKSFFVIECALAWLKAKVKFKILELEDDRAFHTRRALAMLANESNLTDDNWCRVNKEIVKSAFEEHGDTVEALGRNILEAPDRITGDDLIAWIKQEAPHNRILLADPISAKEPSMKPWVDDHNFVMASKTIIKKLDCSLFLVTHPPKGLASGKQNNPDDVAGGAAFLRFTHTVISIYGMENTEKKMVSYYGNRTEEYINREIVLKKTRNGRGQRSKIGFFFDPKNLRHYEKGFID